MSSGPYQSRLINFAVQQTRRLRDRSMQTWRQLRLGTLWGVQVALYPIYAVFQATRLTGRQLRQVVRQTLPQLRSAQHKIQTAVQPTQAPVAIAVDTPIKNTLATVQALSLSVAPAVIEGAILATPPPSLSQQFSKRLRQAVEKLPFFRPANSAPSSALTSSPRGTLVTGEKAVLDSPQPLALSLQATLSQQEAVKADPIRGIATLLPTGRLVLVTEQNRLLDILTAEQEDYLYRRIVGEIASYLHQWRQFAIPQFAPLVLPPPAPRPYALPPVRSLYELMRWMQRSPVAIAVNLFNEATWAEHEGRSPFVTVEPEPIRNPWDAELQPERSLFVRRIKRSQSAPSATPSLSSLPSGQSAPLLSGTRRIVPAGSAIMTSTQTSTSAQTSTLAQTTQPFPDTIPVTVSSSMLKNQPALQPLEHLTETQIQPASADPLNTSIQRDAIDIQASLVEYVKHPLQQLLEWIDQGMVWVEKRVMQFITWFRHNF